jgi:hypothetical protein
MGHGACVKATRTIWPKSAFWPSISMYSIFITFSLRFLEFFSLPSAILPFNVPLHIAQGGTCDNAEGPYALCRGGW